jgi:hypothetical protein
VRFEKQGRLTRNSASNAFWPVNTFTAHVIFPFYKNISRACQYNSRHDPPLNTQLVN